MLAVFTRRSYAEQLVAVLQRAEITLQNVGKREASKFGTVLTFAMSSKVEEKLIKYRNECDSIKKQALNSMLVEIKQDSAETIQRAQLLKEQIDESSSEAKHTAAYSRLELSNCALH